MSLRKTFSNKRGQEEMVGFVVIMLLVAVIFLVLLAVYIRQGPKEPSESLELSQFMDALLEVSTPCGNGLSSYKLDKVIVECVASDKECSPGSSMTMCEAVRQVIPNITESAWEFSENSPKTGYKYSITKETSESEQDVPIFDPPTISSTGVQGRRISSSKLLPGGITIYLEVTTK
jgi:hypothetical protein